MTPNFENVRAATRWAYNEETRQLDFKADSAVTVDEAVSIMTEALGVSNETDLGYNDFSPVLLRQLPEGTMVTLAREGSVCVYIQLPEGKRLTKPFAKRAMKVDEFFSHKENRRVDTGYIRLWWD